MAHFEVPLNLPHASTVSRRLVARLVALRLGDEPSAAELLGLARALADTLAPFEDRLEEPSRADAAPIVAEALALGRALVDEIERIGCGEDRLGRHVRNLFECLERGREGAVLSLRAGEDPGSLLRPV